MIIKFLVSIGVGVLILSGGFISCTAGASLGKGRGEVELKPLQHVKRILFLGDSITYAGEYIDLIDAYLFLHYPNHNYELINAGLPSETVSGLTEPNHAGGAFPRPDLHERLARALTKVKPDMVVACYGMNDGIYYPLETGRFTKYQEGIQWLADQVKQSGAKLWILTPPVFDSFPISKDALPAGLAVYPAGHPFVDYDLVLAKYSEWLLNQRRRGWKVTDIHTPLKNFLLEQRSKQTDFVFAGDGVHLNDMGHTIIAYEVLKSWGAPAASLKYLLSPIQNQDQSTENLKAINLLVHQRQRILTDSWLTDIGHKRPGMAKGIPLQDAMKQAAELENRIRALVISNH